MLNKSIISDINNIRNQMGLPELSESQINKLNILNKTSVLQEGWFKDKINKLRNRFVKQQNTPYGGSNEPSANVGSDDFNSEPKQVDATDVSDKHGEVKMGDLINRVKKIDSDLKNAESEYDDDRPVYNLKDMDKNLKNAESEYDDDDESGEDYYDSEPLKAKISPKYSNKQNTTNYKGVVNTVGHSVDSAKNKTNINYNIK